MALRRTRQTAGRVRSLAARAALVWGLLSFASLQAAFAVMTDRWWPALRHLEYGRKLTLLEAQAVSHRGQPLLLALGTSRTAFGFCAATRPSPEVWQFNFGLTGIGPVQELVCLDQLLHAGVRPAQLLIEIHPAFLHQTPRWCESRAVDVRKLDRRGLEVMCRYAFDPWELALRWARSRLSPWYSHRVALLRHIAPAWLGEASLRDERMLVETDACGWSRFPLRPVDDADRRRMGQWCADLYTGALADFEVTDLPRRAIADMLERCRREQIDAIVLLMPEGRLFRQRYAAGALTRLEAYLQELRRAFGVRVFDCRLWCDDIQFCDGQHLLPEGAEAFTARLQDELLGPWLAEVRRPAAALAERPRDSARK